MKDFTEKYLLEDFSEEFTNAYAIVYSSQQQKTVACILTTEYVPIRYFIETLQRLGRIFQTGSYQKFIFDKRSLRTFHQPSMEWYFLDWKTEVMGYGVTKHRKILPDLPWFVKAVEIARTPLYDQMPTETKQTLDIVYCESFEESLRL